MNATRREFIMGGATAAVGAGLVSVTGCKHLPNVDSVNLAAKAIGGATGLILNECDIPDEARNAIIEITQKVIPWIPEIGQPLETAWTEKAQALVDGMIADGKLDAAYGPVIMAAFKLVVRGFALLEQKCPQVRTSRELLEAAVSGFSEGLISTLKPATCENCCIDVKAFKDLRKTPQARNVRMLAIGR